MKDTTLLILIITTLLNSIQIFRLSMRDNDKK